jgi:uncharacterized protein with beta-barrel porin domain
MSARKLAPGAGQRRSLEASSSPVLPGHVLAVPACAKAGTPARLRLGYLAGSSMLALGVALVVVPSRSAQAADTTISTSISTGSVWSGSLSPNSNFTVTNTGTIVTANAYAITITGTAGSQLGTLLNNGRLVDTAANGRTVFIQAGTVAAVINNGTISANTYAFWNAGSLGTLSNTGLISGRLVNQSTIGAFTNSGTLTYTSFTWDNEAQLRTFTNTSTGLIYGDRAIYSQGTIGTLVNLGTIMGTIHALTITGVGAIQTIMNSGSIIGNVLNSGTVTPTIFGGSGGTVGTMTGTLGNRGTIASANAGLVFGGGSMVMNDQINVGTNTVSNLGASLTLPGITSITGTFAQSAGTLVIIPGTSGLTANRPVSITGGTVQASLRTTDNYVAGNYTLVGGAAGSSFAGVTTATNTISGLSATPTISGNNILLTANSDYIGSTLASLSNTGTISAATALYIASTGSLGSLTNSGTLAGSLAAIRNLGTLGPISNTGLIAGNIVSSATADLSIAGGAGATIGTLTGFAAGTQGTISNTLGNVALSGNLALNDAINVGANTVTNSGALSLTSIVAITGNFSQASGNLTLASGAELVVSGAAVLTGGAVQGNLSTTGNYLVGASGGTLIAGGAGSSYSGVTLTGGSITGLSATAAASGNNLVVAAGNDYIGGNLASLSNTGSISAATALYIAGTGSLGSLSNSGTLAGSVAAIRNLGMLGPIGNTGVIAGDIVNSAASSLVIAGGAGATIGTLTGFTAGSQGTISNTLGNVALSGNLALNDAINVGANTVTNSGALSLGTIVNITGNYAQASGNLTLATGAELVVSGAAAVTGGTVSASLSGSGNYLVGTPAGTLIAGGAGSNYSGATVSIESITGAALGATGGGTNLVVTASNDYVGTGLGSIANTGSISSNYAVYVAGTGSLGSLSNSGTLAGSSAAIRNLGTLGPIGNTGVIAGDIVNSTASPLVIAGGTGATIGTLTGFAAGSQGTISNTLGNVALSGNLALNDAINVGANTVTNSGALSLNSIVAITGNFSQASGNLTLASGAELVVSGAAVLTGGTVSTGLSGTGNYLVSGSGGTLIAGGAGSSYSGVTLAGGSITGLSASAATSGTSLVVAAGNDYIGGNLASLSNTGSLSAATALYIAGTGSLGSLSNSGTLAGSIAAIRNLGTLGPISNTGVIAGNIVNSTASSLVIAGGTGATIGTLTGFTAGSQGTIGNTLGNVALSGNLALNDAINVGANTVTNSGALSLGTIVAITGNFSQASGNLALAIGAELVVSGAAVVTGGTVSASLSATANYLVGASGGTLIAGGAGSGYSGVTFAGAPTGAAFSAATSGTNLTVTAGNDYIGANLASLSNTGNLNAAYPVYVATTGSLGSLSNSGTLAGSIAAIHIDGAIGPILNSGVIAGNIENNTAAALTLAGGTDTTIGTLTGFAAGSQGTINNTRSDLNFTAGQFLLNDVINLGSHAFNNSGATIRLNNAVHVNGNYSQTGGGLLIGATSTAVYGQLVVSGTASLSGGSVTLVPIGNYSLASGQSYTVVQAGNGLSYSGLTTSANGFATGLSTTAGNGFTNLVLTLSSIGGPPIQSTNYTAVGMAEGGAAVGTGIAFDKIAASTTPEAAAFIADVLVPLGVLSPGDKQKALTQLSPSQLTPQLVSVAVSPALNAIVQHQDILTASLDGGQERGLAAGSPGQEGAFWGQFLANTASRDAAGAASAYDAHTYGVMLGVDLEQSPELLVGGALSWLSSIADGRGDLAGSGTHLTSYQVTAYGTWRPGLLDNRLVVDGQLGFGYNHFNQNSLIDFLGRDARASYDGQQYLANLRVGYAFSFNNAATLTPFVGFREVHIENSAYSARGAGTANLRVGGLSVDSFTQDLGFKAATQFATDYGQLLPSFKLAWVHDYTHGPIPVTGVLGGVAFTSNSGRVSQDGASVSVNFTLKRSDSFELGLEYDGELRNDFQSHTGLIKALFKF